MVREANGNEEVAGPDGSRWLVRAKGSTYGYTASLGVADECWGVDPEVVEDALEPMMPERTWPQLLLISTAHRKTTPLFPGRRSAALAALDAPGSTLLVEWSAAPDAELDDRQAWRAASPHWSPGRERLLEAKLARVEAGVSEDEDEPDAVEAFRSQWLNQWRERRVVVAATRDELLVDEAVWADAADPEAVLPPAGLVVALEDNFGQGAAAACAGRLTDDRVVVFGGLFAGRGQACGWAGRVLVDFPGSRLLVGGSLVDDPAVTGIGAPVETVGSAQTRAALPALRQLLADGRLVHDGDPDVAGQVAGLRVIPRESGLSVSPRSGRSDLARCVAWAVVEAAREPVVPEPSRIWGVKGAGRPLPEHLDVTALRLTYLVDDGQLRTVIKNETSARLREGDSWSCSPL